MALKSYHPETLNDNWFEERAEPLNGVMPNDGMKEYSTTTKAELTGAKPLMPRTNPRMVNERSLGQALLQSAGADISHGFRSSIPCPNADQERRYLETTHRAAFGTPCAPTAFQRQAYQFTPAGGEAGRPTERGKSTSGAMGEVYRTSTEPQKDTASQRSWLNSLDPMIVVKSKSPLSNNTQHVTPNNFVHPPTQQYFGRKHSSITNVPLLHQGVFTDD